MRSAIFSRSLLMLSLGLLSDFNNPLQAEVLSPKNSPQITSNEICCLDGTTQIISQTTDDNRERFLQPSPEPLPPEPEETEPILPESEKTPKIPPSDGQGEAIQFSVTKINITGSTIFQPEDFQDLIQPLEGRTVNFQEVQEIAKAITRQYLEQGYITSRAIIPEQEITDGVVEIRIIEGSISEIQIEGNRRLRNSYIRKRLELGTDAPVRVDRIEGQLQLLKANPLIDNIEANIQPATGEGESFLAVEVDEANPWVLGAKIDNYDNVSTGAERFGVTLGHLNLTGNGDSILTSFNRAFAGDSWKLDANYSIPVNAKNGTLQLRTYIERNEIVNLDKEFDGFNLEGATELYEISFRQPLIRSLRKEFALSLGFSRQSSRNFTNDVLLVEPDRTSVLKFGQDFTRRDPQGVWALRSQFNFGLDIFNATVDKDNPQGDALFFSWLGQTQRLQRLNANNLLIIQSDIQLTPDNLLPSERFTIGGFYSVRGYRNNARLGDNGFRLSVEDRITLAKSKDSRPLFQVAPFAELGVVWDNEERFQSPDQKFLAGIGLGLLWQPISGLNIRLDYAPPLVDLDDKGDNVQEDGFYFSINYRN